MKSDQTLTWIKKWIKHDNEEAMGEDLSGRNMATKELSLIWDE